MAKKETNKTKDKGGFEIMGFSLEIPQESFDKLLLAMAEPKKKNQKRGKPTRNDGEPCGTKIKSTS